MSNKQSGRFLAEQRKTLHRNLSFTAAEAYKLLRTNLLFTLPDEQKCRIIGVTSSTRAEGKSLTSVNLSYTLAETGKRVLLIDADMRLSSIAKKMSLRGAPGLSNALVGGEHAEIRFEPSGVLDNWYVLPSGDIPPNPSELLGSKQMEALLQLLAKNFDFIVIDLPPAIVVTDALVISSLVDGMVLVVREDYSDRRQLKTCVQQLRMANIRILGFVLNSSKENAKTYKRYGSSYKYYKKSED